MELFRIVPAGDTALVVELPERIDMQLNAWCVALSRALASELGTIIRDVVIGYSSVTVYFDPLKVDAAWLEAEILTRAVSVDIADAAAGGVVEVPVCYGGDLGPDLADVAAFAGCSEADVIDLHVGREYRVYMVGFVPGFAYMAEVANCRAASSVPEDCGAGRLGRHRGRTNRHLSGGHTWRLEPHWSDGASAL
jgi:inhibitor of KinA